MTELKEITFKYRDRYSYPNWNIQHCSVSSVDECIRIYGLGVDCEYEILSVETQEEARRRRSIEFAASEVAMACGKTDDETFIANVKAGLTSCPDRKYVRVYRALEGDIRIILKDDKNEYRYVVQKDGSLKEKP